MGLKEVAALLVRHRISAVPVVDGDELVGIVSEADLVPLELAPDPRAHLIPPADPPGHLPKVAAEVMTRAVIALPEDADSADASRLMLAVDGIVTLTGPTDPTIRRLAALLVREVPGVVEVRFAEA
jgi:CBS domain-containing protein